jgi:hypothetical protein
MTTLSEQAAAKVQANWKLLNSDDEIGNFTNQWDDMGRYVLTKDNRKIYGSSTKGDKRVQQLYDSKSRRYNKELARGLAGLLINPASPFLQLTTGLEAEDKKAPVKAWLQAQERKVLNVLAFSNFHTESEPFLEDSCGYGTGVMRVMDDEAEVVRFDSKPIFRYRINENNKGDADTVYYEYMWDVRKISQEFGTHNFTTTMKDMLRNKPDHRYTMIHAVEPWKQIFPNTKSRYKYTDLYFIKEEGVIINMKKNGKPPKGFHEFIYAVNRFSKTSDEKYGRGPAMDALPDIKSMNEEKKNFLVAGALRNAPPLQAVDNGLLRKIKLKPYGVSYRRPGSDKIEPLFPSPAARDSIEFLNILDEELKESFFINLLRIVEADRMTATEIMERRDENFRGFGTIVSRFTREWLQPIVNRVFAIMERKGLIDDLPEELKSSSLKKLQVRFISPIARAQRAIESENFNRALQATAPLVEAMPEILDNIDGDKVLRKNMEIFGADFSLLKSDKEIKDNRAARAKQQEDAIAREANATDAGTAKTVAETQNQAG